MPRRARGEVQRFRDIFRAVHADHPGCLDDEWLGHTCRDARGNAVERPSIWSRRNGPWRRVDVLVIGAAPGNAGGMGSGGMGAHATRIPFGGDIAGANLDVLLGAAGLDRNDVFIAAALNHLPEKGGGEPSVRELLAPVGRFPTSLHLLLDTIVAAGPRLLVALGNVALRASVAALRLDDEPPRLPTLARLRRAGFERNHAVAPADTGFEPGPGFRRAWRDAWSTAPSPHVLWLTHPSAQNMSPHARVETRFHGRMLEARDALRVAVRDVLGRQVPDERPEVPRTGIYALPEWRERVGPRHAELDRLWRKKGV
ncbi:MAG: uracil-DNA glycosylase family protein [Longimicrobiales bacterium]